MNNSESTINFMYFIHNFPYNFIEKVWGEDSNLCNHLESKWRGLITSGDDYGYIYFLKFFMDLSKDNKTILLEWVEKNYKSF